MSPQDNPETAVPPNMEIVYFGLLLDGDRAADIAPDALAELQAAHMTHIQKLAADGKLVLAGPFVDGGERRGVFVFRTDTQAEAEALAAADPAVQAGRLSVDIHPWMVEKGVIPLTAVSPNHNHQ